MVHIDDSRHDALRDPGPEQYPAAFVVPDDDIVLFDPPRLGVAGMNRHRFVVVSVRTDNLGRGYLVEPVHIVELRVDAPLGVVRLAEQRELLVALAANPFIVPVAFFDPLRYRRPLLVIREVLGQKRTFDL